MGTRYPMPCRKPISWSPTDISTVAWYEASVANVEKDESDNVSSWHDLVNAYHLIPGVDSFKPIWFADAGGTGFPGIKMGLNSQTRLRVYLGDGVEILRPIGVFLALSYWDNGRECLFKFRTTDYVYPLLWFHKVGANLIFRDGPTLPDDQMTLCAVVDTQNIFNIPRVYSFYNCISPTNSLISIENVNYTGTISSGGSYPARGWCFGAEWQGGGGPTTPYQAYLHEVFITSGALSDAERQSAMTYLTGKYT
jgi:hypothetical protein